MLRRFPLLAALALCLGACSSHRQLDVTGCGPVRWGMSVDEVKAALGAKAQLDRNLPNGKALETVQLTVGGIELGGLVHASEQTGRVDGVYLLYSDGQPLKPQHVERLLSALHAQYGSPTKKLAEGERKTYIWSFPSGNVTLRDSKPSALFYAQNPIGNNPLTPLAN